MGPVNKKILISLLWKMKKAVKKLIAFFSFSIKTFFNQILNQCCTALVNISQKQLPNCGGQKHKATITGFEFRINKTNLLRMGDGNPQGEDHKDNW